MAASPSSADAAETVHTLGFGVRARSCALGPIATATGKAGKGGVAAGAAGAAGGELGRVQKQLVESRSAAAAAEKAAAVLRQQATAAEEAQRAAAAAAKRADGRIKELEAALERREAQSASERLRSEKLPERAAAKAGGGAARAQKRSRHKRRGWGRGSCIGHRRPCAAPCGCGGERPRDT